MPSALPESRNEELHRLLLRQLHKLGLDNLSLPEQGRWLELLALISQAYRNFDEERYALERTLSVSSGEMEEQYLRQRSTYEARLKTIFATLQDLIWLKDVNGRYLACNPMFERLFGAPETEIVGKTDYDFVDRELADFFREHDRMAMERNAPTVNEEWLTFAQNGYRGLFETIKTPMRDEAGTLIGVLGIARDITARSQNEDRLRKLSQAVEQSPNSIVITDLDANIEYVNAAFIQTTGYSLEELKGKNPRILQSGKTQPSTYAEMWAHLAKGENWQGEFINRRKDGSEYVEWARMSPVRNADGRIMNYLAVKEDITERKHIEERIQYLAHFDVLTGLPNRAQLDSRLQYAISLARRNNSNLALMFLDLDRFKDINDTLGHSVGDELLIELAKRLRQVLREEDSVARLGGDEFIVMLPDADEHNADKVAQKILEAIDLPYRIGEYELGVTASIGIAIYPLDGQDLETLSKAADSAMYHAKQDGRHGYRFFTNAMQVQSTRKLQLMNALRNSIEHRQLHLCYQPQVSLRDGRVVGAEALLRWQHPELGNIPPSEFIPIAEESGLIHPIGEWVLRSAMQQAKQWIFEGRDPLIVAVNLSAVQFRNPHFPELVGRVLDEIGLPPEYLELELTESVAMHDPESAISIMGKLHNLGIRLSIDDFGTGYSSLSYLKKFQTYKLKIDQSFVRDISTDHEDRAIVSAIVSMARSLGLQTIAEGVETPGQLQFLTEQGCDEVQGYFYSKPIPAEQFIAYLAGHEDTRRK